MNQRLSFLAAATCMIFPLSAGWQEQWDCPYGLNPPTWVDNKNKIYAQIDYLLWFPQEEGLSLSSLNTLNQLNEALFLISEEDQKGIFFKTRWNSGIRAYIGYKPCDRKWDVRLGYTYFSNRVSNSFGPFSVNNLSGILKKAQGEVIVGNYYQINLGQGPNAFTSLVSNWKLKFNQVDLEFGREYFLVDDVTIRPFFGVRGAFIDQNNYSFQTVSGVNQSQIVSYVIINNFISQMTFNGFGGRAGFEGGYKLTRYFELYGSIGADLLWGWSKVKQQFISSFTNPTQLKETFQNHSHRLTSFGMDVAFGIKWSQWIDCNTKLITLKFGWEEHLYSNLNQLQMIYTESISSTGDINTYRGDLSLTGFIFSGGILF